MNENAIDEPFGHERDEAKEAGPVGVRARFAFVVEAIVDRDPSEVCVGGDEREAASRCRAREETSGSRPGRATDWRV